MFTLLSRRLLIDPATEVLVVVARSMNMILKSQVIVSPPELADTKLTARTIVKDFSTAPHRQRTLFNRCRSRKSDSYSHGQSCGHAIPCLVQVIQHRALAAPEKARWAISPDRSRIAKSSSMPLRLVHQIRNTIERSGAVQEESSSELRPRSSVRSHSDSPL